MAKRLNKLVGAFILLSFLVAVGGLFSYSLILGNAGLEDPTVSSQLNYYINILGIFAIGIIALYIVNFAWKRNDELGDNIGFFSMGDKPSFSYFKKFTAPQLTLLSLIVFSTVFLIANRMGVGSGTGLRVLPQQFSPIDSLMFSTAIIPVSENLLAAFTLGFFLLLLQLFFIKYKINSSEYRIYAYAVATLIMGLFGVIWHSTVYSNSDVALFVVFIFWGLGGFFSLATGLFTPFWMLHLTNNFFIDYSRLYSSDVVFYTAIAIIGLLSAVYYFTYRGRLLGGSE